MNRFRLLPTVGAMLVAVVVLSLPDRASAEERRHHSSGTAQFINPNDFVGRGQATHLGKYTEVGSAAFLPSDDPTAIPLVAWAIYTAANGDQLEAVITGQLNGVTGAITANVTYVGGTGRFADAIGSANLAGQMLLDGTIAVTVEGTIDY